MVLPLLLIAALWQRPGARGRRFLRGRSFTVLGRELHTTSVVTGLLIVGVGVLFWTTNGPVGAPELVPLDARARLRGEHRDPGEPDPGHPRRRPHRRDRARALGQTPPYPRSR
ncbi:hypothetical protein LP422_10890 [Janibacter limosus]|uniref:hypothetical protein n=1 Tax=Janibacter limosus TaxID=53458 RepID=UPI0035DDB430|nr:hypothetical protein LP422_10890 [Janibacter limosus]